jgi:DNA primase
MRFPPAILDDIRARLSVSSVVGRRVQLKKQGREWRGLSPFKQEKTPSFFVNDQKGFYHCFASGEHGDIFTFLMKTEGLSFPEAVERLAEEAGVPLPKLAPREAEREVERADERTRHYALLDAAQRFFAERLRGHDGAEARAYLEQKRGLGRDAWTHYGLGYAPPSRSALKEHLAAKGFSIEDMSASGMLIHGEDIAVPYDRFRHRIMFPIADLKGRVIAFGGRALDPAAPAKYLNSPETPLFHKGHTLYHADKARGPAHEKGRVIAVEGYMDVVALAEAGFVESVAPLGTALTEDQARLLWRMAPEPILCFDGDGAGRRAAHRAIDVVLPHLKPGQSVRIAFLPDGLDPDDLIRQRGAIAMDRAIAEARPLADVLWDREWGRGDWSTPERRAALERQLRQLVARIADNDVRAQYERVIRDRLWNAWRGGRRPLTQSTTPPARTGPAALRGRQARPSAYPSRLPPSKAAASDSLRTSTLGHDSGAVPMREAVLLVTLLNHPWLIEQVSEILAATPFASAAGRSMRDGLLSALARDIPLDSASLRTQLSEMGNGAPTAAVERALTHNSDRFVKPGADPINVETGWRHTHELHERDVALRLELAAAEDAWFTAPSDAVWDRIVELKKLLADQVSLERAS